MNFRPLILQLVFATMVMMPKINLASQPKPKCPTGCLDIPIAFPFDISSNCHLDEYSLYIICNTNDNTTKPFVKFSEYEFIHRSLDGNIRISASVALDCYNKCGSINGSILELFSSKFHPTGYKSAAVVGDTKHDGSLQPKDRAMAASPSLASGEKKIWWLTNKKMVDRYVRKEKPLIATQKKSEIAAALALSPSMEIALELKEQCLLYLCRFKEVNDMLQDYIPSLKMVSSDDESSSQSSANSSAQRSRDRYKLFSNSLDLDEPMFMHAAIVGDTKKDGSLQPKDRAKLSTFFHIALGLVFPTIGISWIFWSSKKKKIAKLRQNLFVENGGLILEKMVLRRKKCIIFTAADLIKATNNYNESRVFHRDRNEPVYKGTLLEDGVNKPIAIKSCEKIDPIQIQDFISKLVNFSWIDHMNVVKLIGCCLETQVPLLVYEFFTDKTLYDSIHDEFSFLSWERRLKIATETARSLLYMHSGGETPIIHGNISSSNILLDHGFMGKIAFPSFTGFFGTGGEKSDVYSFGVILAELLTGDEVVNFDRPKGEEFLAVYFISALKDDRMLEILEPRLVMEVNIEQLKEVSMLTEMCLRERYEERPTMIDVVLKLEHVLRSLELHEDEARFNHGGNCLEMTNTSIPAKNFPKYFTRLSCFSP